MCPGQEKGLNGPQFQTEKVKLTLAKAPVDDRQVGAPAVPYPPGCCLFTSLCLSLPFAIPPSAHRGR